MSARDEQLARTWFAKAERDLFTAETMLAVAHVPADVVCFHCHQATEKYLKGFLAWQAVSFSRTHDLAELLAQCSAIEPRLASLQPLAILLTDYAVDARYPGLPHSDPSLSEARRAHDAAREVRHAIRTALGLPPT
jgi:HEPN domain-containing protein